MLVASHELLLDGRLALTVSSAKAGDPVTVRARMVTPSGNIWRSEAVYRAGDDGTVDLASAEPLAGSYLGVDPNGLLWSMAPDDLASAQVQDLADGVNPLRVELAATSGGQDLGEAESTIRLLPAGVTRVPVREGGLYGELFVPPGEGPFRPVLVFGGSDGGLSPRSLRSAAFCAGHGYLTFSLAYFAAPGLPEELVDIELEYFARALEFLSARPEASGPPAVIGTSRGGELSLLLGLYLGVETVIANVPSPIVHAGITRAPDGWLSNIPAWRFEGRPIPYLSHTDGKLYMVDGAIACTPTYLDCLDDWDRVSAAMMHLEDSPSTVLLLSGARDPMWPSALYSELAMTRLRRRPGGRQRHVTYPGAGHTLVPPVLPATITVVRHEQGGELVHLGGVPAANSAAGRGMYAEILSALAGELVEEAWT
ncbi:MAG TPA: acyl-CoA thioesterase/bile acid-CoA:amino acid N-acyltransferase family protein [Acidimicrobiales bacterium]|nr:acyl-CoA thioesterase/bile acid-CoA:amino acid N-acyltransferase family protein [Acidimicrobiales bacterium]